MALKRLGLLMTPEEREPPPIATRANALQVRNADFDFDDKDGLAALYADPDLRARHADMLPAATPRRRGEIETERALAEAKLSDAETVEDALVWLKPKERMVVMRDAALLERLVQLKPATAEVAAAAE
jgi:membrane glycosyltransferase